MFPGRSYRNSKFAARNGLPLRWMKVPPEGNDLRDQVRNLVKEDGICIKRFSCEIGADLLLRLASTTNHPHR
jgi:hypothetical protein